MNHLCRLFFLRRDDPVSFTFRAIVEYLVFWPGAEDSSALIPCRTDLTGVRHRGEPRCKFKLEKHGLGTPLDWPSPTFPWSPHCRGSLGTGGGRPSSNLKIFRTSFLYPRSHQDPIRVMMPAPRAFRDQPAISHLFSHWGVHRRVPQLTLCPRTCQLPLHHRSLRGPGMSSGGKRHSTESRLTKR